jgi:hypothetical protein
MNQYKIKLPAGQTHIEHIRQAAEERGNAVDEVVFRRGVFYAAIRFGEQSHCPAGQVVAYVIQSYRDGQYTCFDWICETDNPSRYDAPRTLLERLTPLADFINSRWRKACWKRVRALEMKVSNPPPEVSSPHKTNSPCAQGRIRIPSEEWF